MTSKIFRSSLFLAVTVLLCALLVGLGVLLSHFSRQQVRQLQEELSLAVTGTQQYGDAFLENLEEDTARLTWIAADGTVLFDSQAEPANMGNHADRQEFRQALQTGYGSAVRSSDTLLEQTVYQARRLEDGSVLRISASQKTGWSLLLELSGPVLAVVVLAVVLAALLARRMARKIVAPLNSLDLEQPLKNPTYEELGPMLDRLHQQHNQIRRQMDTQQRRTAEFQQILGSMQEGLVLLSSQGKILSINPAAMALFGTDESAVGKHFLAVEPRQQVRDALNDALDTGHGSTRLSCGQKVYQLDLSRIADGGAVVGAVVLAVDITQQQNAEQLRREFSANVSHELKTPLQGIIGSAELLKNQLVKPEDTPRFVEHIHREATRLVALVEDILRLSQLDEGVRLPTGQVAMLPLVQEVVASLESSAREKQVLLTLEGGDFTVTGTYRLLQELVYNLCDNAIKYNRPGGSVRVVLQAGTLTVEDTGIGIPEDHQSRVFERFYRVDKSHSKSSGGTGLGLSIVKHAAACHNAQLQLNSQPGRGTTVTVRFPEES